MHAKMIQEGDVAMVPNPGPLRTVSGAAAAVTIGAITVVGIWNEGGFEENQEAPLIMRGHVNAQVDAGAEAVSKGDALVIDQDTGIITKGDADEENGLFLFGHCWDKRGITADTSKLIEVRLPPQ